MKRLLQPAAIILLTGLIIWLVEAQFHFFRNLFGGRPLGQRELATYFLGRYLAEHYPGKTAIVLSNPFSQKPGQPSEVYQFEKAGLHGLERGLGKAIKIEAVVFPDLKPEALKNPRSVSIDPTTTTPLSYLLAEGALDKVTREHPRAEIIVSLIGLPLNVRQRETWQSNRQFGLLLPDLRMVGNQAAIRQAIETGKIAALVLNKPGAPPETQPLGRDERMEFDQRFLLITRENLVQILRSYPHLLP